MSLVRKHRERVLAAQSISAVDPVEGGGLARAVLVAGGQSIDGLQLRAAARAANSTEAQVALRLTHDLRRLSEIKSIERKIDAKREMLPEYGAWIEGVLEADAGVGAGTAGGGGPVVMIWSIDTGDYATALRLGAFVLRHKVVMPSRYERDAATILVEEIAGAALKVQSTGARFRLAILEEVEQLTAGYDMHDQVRAKLAKAIGVELHETALRIEEAGVSSPKSQVTALLALQRAQALNDRIGVKDRIKRLEKALGPLAAPAAAPAA